MLAIWLLSGVDLTQILLFAAYEIGFIALPGIALLWALRGSRPGFLAAIALGWPLGSALEILVFSATAAVGARTLFLLYPLVTVVLSTLVIRRRRSVVTDVGAPPFTSRLLWIAAGALSLGLVSLSLMFLPQVPLPSTQASVAYSPDFVYQMSKIAEVMYHWPPTNPGLSGVPLPYEWFVFFHMAAVTQVTRLSIPIIALRLDFLPLLVVIGCQLLMVGRALAGAAWAGVIALVVLFLLGPLDMTTDTRGAAPFFANLGVQLWGSWTLPFGLMFLIPLIYLISQRLLATHVRIRADAGFWILITLLMIGASGAKATILPVLLSGTALYIAVMWVTRRTIQPVALALLALQAFVFVVTFYVIYRGGASGIEIDPLASLARTFPVLSASDSGLPGPVSAVLLPLAYLCGLLGMLLPLAGILYLLRRRHRAAIAAYAWCLCVLAAGVLIANVVHQDLGYSELYFQDAGYIAGCIVAAAGIRLAWIDMTAALSTSRRALVIELVAWVVLLALIATITALTIRLKPSEVAMYSVLGAGGVLFILVWRRVMAKRGRPTAGTWALGLIPLLAACALTAPIQLAPTIGRVLTGSPLTVTQPDPQKIRGLTPGLLAALEWLQDNSSTDTVFAVSNHWIDPDSKDGRFYYYSAFSERQVFIEGYDAVRYQISTRLDTPAGADFARRMTLNNAVFNSADATALQVLTQQYSVSYLFIDRVDNDSDPAVVQLGTVVFNDADATIVKVG